MKNLTIKKVALGVMLAGYAASSAFALTATTSNTIKGHPPLVSHDGTATSPVAGINVTVLDSGGTQKTTGALALGDTLVISYDLYDADGDTEDGTAKETASTAVIFIKKGTGGSWAALPSSAVTTAAGSLKWTLGNEAIGVSQIGYKIQAKTTFGDPIVGSWVTGDNIALQTGAGTNPTDPGGTPGTGGTGGGDNGGGVDLPDPTNPGTNPPITVPSTYAVHIILVDRAGTAVPGNVQADSEAIFLGHTYEAKVHDGSSYIAGNTLSTAQYSWYVSGSNLVADATTTVPSAATDNYFVKAAANYTGNGHQYALPKLNTGVTFTAATAAQNDAILGTSGNAAATGLLAGQPKAGLQGFKLGVLVTGI